MIRETYSEIKSLLNDRLIISNYELLLFSTRIYIENSILDQPFSTSELKMYRWLLNFLNQVISRVVAAPPIQLKTIARTDKTADLNCLNGDLWNAILAYLSLRERAKIIHTSKMWHYLTQNSRVIEIIAPFKYINSRIGMSYLLTYNFRKISLLLTFRDPTILANMRRFNLADSSLYVLHREEGSQEERLFYLKKSQKKRCFDFKRFYDSICCIPDLEIRALTISEPNLRRLHSRIQWINQLQWDKPERLSPNELETLESLIGDYNNGNDYQDRKRDVAYLRNDRQPTIKSLRKKVQTAWAWGESKDLNKLQRSCQIEPPSNAVLRLLYCVLGVFFFEFATVIFCCGPRPPNNRFSMESCHTLGKLWESTFLIMVGLFLVMNCAHRNRCARKVERLIQNKMRIFSSSNEKPLHRLENDLKEYVIPPIIKDKAYSWSPALKNKTRKVQIIVDEKKEQCHFKKRL